MKLTREKRLERLDTMIAEGRLLRGQWTDGQERACLLAALSPEAGEKRDPAACPASVMPRWLANLTPWMDDNGTKAKWSEHVRRYAAVARRWHVLKAPDWRRLDYACRALSVRDARQWVKGDALPAALSAIDGVLTLLDREIAGDHVEQGSWAAARAAAGAAAGDAARAAAGDAAGAAAWAAAWAAAEDRIIDGILTAIESACSAAEAQS